ASPLIGAKKKEFVLDYRTAEAAAELILFHNGARLVLFVQEEIIGVKLVVAQEFKHRAVELIGPRFRYHLDVGPGSPAVAGVVQAGLYFKFLNGIRVGNRDASLLQEGPGAAAAKVIHVGPIH